MSSRRVYRNTGDSRASGGGDPARASTPGKVPRTSRLPARSGRPGPVQGKAAGAPAGAGADRVQDIAARGVSSGGGELPHKDRIAASFGDHAGHLDSVSAHVGGDAAQAADAIGARAYATGSDVAFGEQPDLHTAAHEAAHVVQQRGGVQLEGGVGTPGDKYERNADAVADRVVRGESAGDLLDAVAPAPSGGGSAAVQRKVVQMDVKSDLRSAMDGWGTDEDAIYSRLESATAAELQAVIADQALMDELRGELSGGEMRRVLDLLSAPLADKLRLAIRGWGTDEAYIFSAIGSAPVAEVMAVARDSNLIAQVDGDLSGDLLHRWRGEMARRIYVDGGDATLAFSVIMGSEDARAARLRRIGNLTQQRALLDGVIMGSGSGDAVIQAFQSYWGVDTTTRAGANSWPPATVKHIHVQMKALPDQDTRSGVWRELALTSDPNLINRAAWNGGAGRLIVGSNASTTSQSTMGHGTELSAAAAAGDTTLQVTEPARFAVGDTVALDRAGPNRDVGRITAISGNQYTIDTALAHAHGAGETLTPDDDTAVRRVNWLSATVRHEIAHSVETALGGVTGFTVGLGGWWTGDDFDTWASAMGSPWATNDGSTISDEDKGKIKDAIVDAVKNQKGSLFTLGLPPDHPIDQNKAKQVPVIVAAEACLSAGDGFYRNANNIYAANGKRFSVSWWYKKFMYHNEDVVSQRVADYGLYAPAEFFAEAYTVFYEEAGRPGVTEADYGRLIRNGTWRSWIRDNIHNRGHAPAGTGGGSSPGGDSAGATVGSAGYGRGSGNPGP